MFLYGSANEGLVIAPTAFLMDILSPLPDSIYVFHFYYNRRKAASKEFDFWYGVFFLYK